MRSPLLAAAVATASVAACFSPPEQHLGDRVALVTELEGCWVPGTTERVGFRGVDQEHGKCAAFTLVGGTFTSFDAGIVIGEEWKAERWSVKAAPCDGWGDVPVSPSQSIKGEVHFVASSAPRPAAEVDVTLQTGSANPPEIHLLGRVSEYVGCD